MNLNNTFYFQVIAGGAELDKLSPGWYKHFTPDDLDQLQMRYCFEDVLAILKRKGIDVDISHYSEKLGMKPPYERNPLERAALYEELETMWREYIIQRQALPDIPEGHVFLGHGIEGRKLNTLVDAYACNGGKHRKSWVFIRHPTFTSVVLYYCVAASEGEFIAAFTGTTPPQEETRTMEDEVKMEITEDGSVRCYGYTFSPNDIDVIEAFVNAHGTLDDAGFDLNVTEITIGCRRFSREKITDLFKQYQQLKERKVEEEVMVTVGDRVEHKPTGRTYIVACVGTREAKLINLQTGRRWSDTTVRLENGPTKLPLKAFVVSLCSPSLSDWQKL